MSCGSKVGGPVSIHVDSRDGLANERIGTAIAADTSADPGRAADVAEGHIVELLDRAQAERKPEILTERRFTSGQRGHRLPGPAERARRAFG